jgi:hypothetical protein
MGIFKKLFGGNKQDSRALPADVQTLVNDALSQIESGMSMSGSATAVDGSKAMAAVEKLSAAHQLLPDNPLLHYAWASALFLAMQHKSAEDEIRQLAKAHPDYLLARLSAAAFDEGLGMSHFMFPAFGANTRSLPDPIARKVQTGTLVPVRDGLEPRAAAFQRNPGYIKNLNALKTAKVDITAEYITGTDPLVFAVFLRVWDDSSNPFRTEMVGFPLLERATPDRLTYEYLCAQRNIDVAILSPGGDIQRQVRLPIPPKMRRMLDTLQKRLETDPGRPYSVSECQRALGYYQSHYEVNSIQF